MVQAFHTPQTVAEAVALKTELQDSAAFLAGGTALGSSNWPLHVQHLISLAALGLGSIQLDARGLRIGAACTLQELIESEEVPRVIREACGHLVNRNVRNIATVGGHIAANMTHAAVIPILVALDAYLSLGDSESSVPIHDWLSGGRHGLITSVVLSRSARWQHAAVGRHVRNANDVAAVTAAVSLEAGGQPLRGPRVAVGGVAPNVVRLEGLEQKLAGESLPEHEELQSLVQQHVSPTSDLRGSARLKRYLSGVLVADALLRTVEGEEASR